jgi:4-amino-4-deoxy-L-arabinose transferase-like glycosyltransferase
MTLYYLIIIPFFYLFIFFGTGRLFNTLLKNNNYFFNSTLFSITIGSVIIGNVIFIAGFFYKLNSNYLLILLILLGIFGIISFYRDIKISNILNFKINIQPLFKVEIFLIILTLFFLALNFFQILAPPVNDDALMYHLQIPKSYIENNSIFYNSFVPYNAPHLLELLLIFPMQHGNIYSVQVFLYLVSFLLICQIYKFSKNYFGRLSSLLAILIVISTPKFTYINSSGLVEVYLALITISALWIYIEIFNEFKHYNDNKKLYRFVIVASLLLGSTAAIKYYGLFSIVAVGSAFLFYIIKNQNLNYKKLILLSLFYGLIFSSPFYLKNIYFTGNPIYPALYSIFGGIDWSQSLDLLSNDFFSQNKKIEINVFNFLLSPFFLFLDYNTISGRSGYGILLPILLPVVFFHKRKLERFENFNINFILYYSLTIIVFWFLFSFHRDRHLFILVIILAIIISYLVTKLYEKKYKLTNFIILIAFLVGMVPNFAGNILFNKKYIAYKIQGNTEVQFLNTYIPFIEDYNWINKNLPNNAKVLNMIGNRQYYIKKDQFYPSPAFQGKYDFSVINNPYDLYNDLKNDGITHIITHIKLDDKEFKIINNIDKTNFLKNYNNLFNSVLLNHSNLIYKSNKKSILKSRTLDLGERTSILYVYLLR